MFNKYDIEIVEVICIHIVYVCMFIYTLGVNGIRSIVKRNKNKP